MKFKKFPFKIEKQYRLPGYDYSENGYYFITICTKDRENYFSEITNNTMNLSQIGKIVNKFWTQIPNHFPVIKINKYCVMPNHIHGILNINDLFSSVGTHHDAFLQNNNNLIKNKIDFSQLANKSTQTISLAIKLFKSSVKQYCNKNNLNFFWQSRFHDRIIRNEREYFAIKRYIQDNPKNWEKDRNNNKK